MKSHHIIYRIISGYKIWLIFFFYPVLRLCFLMSGSTCVCRPKGTEVHHDMEVTSPSFLKGRKPNFYSVHEWMFIWEA